MDLIIKNEEIVSINEAIFTEIKRSFTFAKNTLQNATSVQKIIYKLQTKNIIIFLQKTIDDFLFYYLSSDDKEKIRNELKNNQDFLKNLS